MTLSAAVAAPYERYYRKAASIAVSVLPCHRRREKHYKPIRRAPLRHGIMRGNMPASGHGHPAARPFVAGIIVRRL